jgi:hypothetical protein
MPPFHPTAQSARQLFADSEETYSIPPNQRDYTWTLEQASDFYDDLWSTVDPNASGLFLGQILLTRGEQNDWEVIDGQQRLTTLTLLLACVRRRFHQLDMHGQYTAVHQQVCVTETGDLLETLRPRLRASPSIDVVYDHVLMRHDWDGTMPANRGIKRKIRRVKPILDFFWGAPSSDRTGIGALGAIELSRFQKAIEKCSWIRVELASRESAFEIFERTNARGQDLETSDLLKNYLYSTEVPDITEQWKVISENADGQLVPMLRQYHISHVGYLQKRELYRKLLMRSRETTPKTLTQEILDYSHFYAASRSSSEKTFADWLTDLQPSLKAQRSKLEECGRSLAMLRMFNQTQFLPLLYSLCGEAKSSGLRAPALATKLRDLLRAFECFHFVNNSVCGFPANRVEHPFAEAAAESRGRTFSDAVDSTIALLRRLRAGKSEFIAKFCSLAYGDADRAIRYYFHRTVYRDYSKTPPRWLPISMEPVMGERIFTAARRTVGSLWDVHHLLPQAHRPTGAEWVDQIGNLLPLPQSINLDLGAMPPVEQLSRLTSAHARWLAGQPYHQRFVAMYQAALTSGWDESASRARAEEMAVEAYDLIWTF